MTSRERLLAAYAHQPVDYVPCSPRLWAWMLEYYGDCGTATLLRAADEFDFDIHISHDPFSHPYHLHSHEALALPGVAYRGEQWEEEGYTVYRRIFRTPAGELTDVTRYPPREPIYGIAPNPVRTEHLVKSSADLPALRYLITEKSEADFSYFFATERQLGERGLLMAHIFSALCHRASDVYPMEELMMAALADRPFFDELQAMFQREMMDEVQACLRAGIRHFFANWYVNSLSTGWSPRLWQEVFAPQLTEMTTAVHAAGGTVNFYDDGKCMGIIDVLADCGIDVLQTLCPPPVGDVELAVVKQRIGDRVCLMGHTDLLYVLQRGTPALVEATVRQAIETAAPGGGFILGTSDSIRNGTPTENVRAYFAAARRYGKQ